MLVSKLECSCCLRRQINDNHIEILYYKEEEEEEEEIESI
ncbi:MAG: hypothetical protein ACI8RD_000228 [Bacillariaceae sp.]|jgi:hypothetical protein